MNLLPRISYFFIIPLLIYINLRILIPLKTLHLIVTTECAFLALSVVIYYGKTTLNVLKKPFTLDNTDFLIIGIQISWTVLFFCQIITYYWIYRTQKIYSVTDEYFCLLMYFSCIAAIAHLMAPDRRLFNMNKLKEITLLCIIAGFVSLFIIKQFN